MNETCGEIRVGDLLGMSDAVKRLNGGARVGGEREFVTCEMS